MPIPNAGGWTSVGRLCGKVSATTGLKAAAGCSSRWLAIPRKQRSLNIGAKCGPTGFRIAGVNTLQTVALQGASWNHEGG